MNGKRKIDLTGKKIDRWSVLKEINNDHCFHDRAYLCVCDCGSEHIMKQGALTRLIKLGVPAGCKSCRQKLAAQSIKKNKRLEMIGKRIWLTRHH